MDIFRRTLKDREEKAGTVPKPEKETPKDEKPKKGMSQADFSYGREKKYAEGGEVSSFGSAFAKARKAGDKTFMYKGKKYTTETKEEAGEKKVERRNRDSEDSYHKGKKKELGDKATALYEAKRNAPKGTSDLAKKKISEAADTMAKKADSYDIERGMSSYKPRRPGTTLQSVRGMGANYENKDATSETFKKGGMVKRGWGKARCK